MCANAASSKFISNFQMHVGAATNYSVVPWGGVASNAMQFSRGELLTMMIDERFQTEHCTKTPTVVIECH